MKNVENMEYNTTRNHLTIREYGRHIQKMAEYVLTIEDREKRQKNAAALVELMGFLNPQLKNVEDFRHKLWDHLFLISDFTSSAAPLFNIFAFAFPLFCCCPCRCAAAPPPRCGWLTNPSPPRVAPRLTGWMASAMPCPCLPRPRPSS